MASFEYMMTRPAKGGGGTTTTGTELPIPTLGLISNHSSVMPTGIGVGVTASPSMSQNNMVIYNSMTHAMTACPQQQPVAVGSLQTQQMTHVTQLQQQQFQQTQQLLQQQQQQQSTSQLSPFYVDPQLQLFQQAQQQIQMEHQQQQTPNQSQQQVQVQVQLQQQQQQEQFEQQESNQGSDESLQQIQLDPDSDSQLNLDPANYFDSMLASLNCDLLDGPGDADLDPTGASAIFNFSSLMDGDELPSISDSALSAAFDGVDDAGGLGNFGQLINVPGQRRQPARVSIRFKSKEIYDRMCASNQVTFSNSDSSSILNSSSSSNSYNSYGGSSGLNFGMGFLKSTPSSTVTSDFVERNVNMAGHGSGGYSSSYNTTGRNSTTTFFSSNSTSTSNAYHQQSLSKFVDDFGITDVTPLNIKQSNWALGSSTTTFSSPSSSNYSSKPLETLQPPPSSTVTQEQVDAIPEVRRSGRRKGKKKKSERKLDQDCDPDLDDFQHWEKEQMILEKRKSQQDKSSSESLLKSGKVKPIPIAIMRKSSAITGARLGTFISNTFTPTLPPVSSHHPHYHNQFSSGSSSSNSSSSSRKRKVISTVFSHSDPMASKKPKITFSPLISSANLSPEKRSSSTSTPTSYTSSVPPSPPFLPIRILPPIRPQTIFNLPSAGLGSLTSEICAQMPNLFQGRTPKRKLKPKGKGKDKHHRGHYGYHGYHSHHHHGYYRGPYGHGSGKGKGHGQKQVPHQHHRCALHSPSKIEAAAAEASPGPGVTTRSGSQKLAAEKLKQQKAPPPKPPPPPPQQKPRIPIENIFLRKYDPIRILNRLRKAALPITTKNTERDKVMICNDFLEKKAKKAKGKTKKAGGREQTKKKKRNGVRGHRVSNTNHGRKQRMEERAKRRKERDKQREVKRKQRLEKIKFRLKTQAKMKVRQERVDALLKQNNNNKNEATTAASARSTSTSTSTMPPPRYPPPWSQKVNGATTSTSTSTSTFKVDKRAINRKALEMLQKKRREPPPTLQELARRRQRRARELRKKLTVNGKLTVNEADLLKRRRGLTVKYKKPERGVSHLKLRVMTAYYLRRALARLRGHPKATKDLLEERRKKWKRRVKRREKVMEAFDRKEKRRHTLKRLRKQQRKLRKLAKRRKLSNAEKAKLAGSNIPKKGSKVKVGTGKKVPVTKNKSNLKGKDQRSQSQSKFISVNSYGKPVYPGMKRSKNQVEFPLTKIKMPLRPAQVTSGKFTIPENPYLLHIVELLRHKRELQGQIETLETEGVVNKLPPPPEKPDPSTMKAPPLLSENWQLARKQAKHILSQRLQINCAIAGFSHVKLGPLEIIADAVSNFMTKATERLKGVAEMEMMDVDHGFPDAIERLLNEMGFGGIHGLNEFHKVKYLELGSRMADQCTLLRRQYAYKCASRNSVESRRTPPAPSTSTSKSTSASSSAPCTTPTKQWTLSATDPPIYVPVRAKTTNGAPLTVYFPTRSPPRPSAPPPPQPRKTVSDTPTPAPVPIPAPAPVPKPVPAPAPVPISVPAPVPAPVSAPGGTSGGRSSKCGDSPVVIKQFRDQSVQTINTCEQTIRFWQNRTNTIRLNISARNNSMRVDAILNRRRPDPADQLEMPGVVFAYTPIHTIKPAGHAKPGTRISTCTQFDQDEADTTKAIPASAITAAIKAAANRICVPANKPGSVRHQSSASKSSSSASSGAKKQQLPATTVSTRQPSSGSGSRGQTTTTTTTTTTTKLSVATGLNKTFVIATSSPAATPSTKPASSHATSSASNRHHHKTSSTSTKSGGHGHSHHSSGGSSSGSGGSGHHHHHRHSSRSSSGGGGGGSKSSSKSSASSSSGSRSHGSSSGSKSSRVSSGGSEQKHSHSSSRSSGSTSAPAVAPGTTTIFIKPNGESISSSRSSSSSDRNRKSNDGKQLQPHAPGATASGYAPGANSTYDAKHVERVRDFYGHVKGGNSMFKRTSPTFGDKPSDRSGLESGEKSANADDDDDDDDIIPYDIGVPPTLSAEGGQDGENHGK